MGEDSARGATLLAGKVAVVTGAGRGLGKAYAEALAAAGAAVVVNDIDEQVAAAVVASITADGGIAVAQPGAVGATEVADALVQRAIAEFGRLDVMCTNAGVLRDKTLRNTSDEDFDVVLHTHLRGTFTCGRSAFQQFRAPGWRRPADPCRLARRAAGELRPDRLLGRQSGDRRPDPHLGRRG